MRVNFKLDDVVMEADAAHGVQGSDMAREKIFGKVVNFKPKDGTPLRTISKVEDELEEVDKFFEKTDEQQKFADAVLAYEDKYQKDNNISVEEKVSVILDII